MIRLELKPARRYHCGRAARHLRTGHRAELERMGIDVHAALVAAYEGSFVSRVLTIDGTLAALFGMVGSPLTPVGAIWLALTNWGARFPVAVTTSARNHLEEWSRGKVELVTSVLGGDDAGQRFAAFLGFQASHAGPGQRAWSRNGRRRLVEHLRHEPDLRVGCGTGYMINLSWQPERDL